MKSVKCETISVIHILVSFSVLNQHNNLYTVSDWFLIIRMTTEIFSSFTVDTTAFHMLH